MFNTTISSYLIQLLDIKLKSIYSFLNSFYDIFKYVSFINLKSDDNNERDNNDDDLFSNSKINYKNFTSTSKNLHSCAVSEFDYDFTSPNPFSWEFQNLVLSNQNQLNNNNT
ncbi:hypothetical protein C6P42_005111, partial [Pichia californica]